MPIVLKLKWIKNGPEAKKDLYMILKFEAVTLLKTSDIIKRTQKTNPQESCILKKTI